jgi:CheY-like chemotaxis protein
MSKLSQTVLVVDDDLILLDLAKEVIASMGHSVLCAHDGTEALGLLQRDPTIAVLITDIRMPGMTGWELGRRSAALRPEVKIIYSTAFGGLSIPDDGQVDAPFLSKPWRAASLEEMVRRVLASG